MSDRALYLDPVPAVGLALAMALLAGCGPADAVREYFREPTPHEAYALSLSHAGLLSTALGADWVRAGEEALARPLVMDAPYREGGYFPGEEPSALGYRFPLRRGQRLRVLVEIESQDSVRLFVDLFRAAPDTTRAPALVLSGEPGTEMVFEPWRSGDYLLRVQPELLRNGRFRVTIQKEPSLTFPVAGRSSRSIGSFFGDPREAGVRAHHGVDIFAPRGTPALAAARAYVRQVDTTPVGGRVVWLREAQRNASIYYAHLQEILAREGTWVDAGDTVGLVGNTGNARTTPPHLHFGLYLRGEGPYDPWDFLAELPSEAPGIEVDLVALGKWIRTSEEEIPLRLRPAPGGEVAADLPRHTAMRVMGGTGSWFRVKLPDGSSGFVAGNLTEDLSEAVRTERFAQASPLQAEPRSDALVMEEIPIGADLPVLGTFGSYLYVRSPGGRAGWIGVSR